MNTKYFSARDIREYLNLLVGEDELNKIPAFPPNCRILTDEPTIKTFLFSVMKRCYSYCEEGCTSTIIGETGIEGLHLDFNFGLRLDVPEGNFHVTIGDADSRMIFLDEDLSDVRLISVEHYFIRWQVEIYLDGKEVFFHVLDLKERPVLITFKKNEALGDTLAFLPSIVEFKRLHCCNLSVLLPEYLREFVAYLYPDLKQVDTMHFNSYATYEHNTYGGNFAFCFDLRETPLDRASSFVLGTNTLSAKPIFKPTLPPVTEEPYVCIAVQASSVIKSWLYPGGWDIVVDYLKSLGYRIFCIDKNAEQTSVRKPEGAENFTGNFPIMERANMLYHAEFFIGLGSGLSWVANAVDCPVVMICGFSQDWCEFYTPYRVANRRVCNGCFNDVRVKFLKELCPYLKDTEREYECQRAITPRQVINAINQLIADKNLTPPALKKI